MSHHPLPAISTVPTLRNIQYIVADIVISPTYDPVGEAINADCLSTKDGTFVGSVTTAASHVNGLAIHLETLVDVCSLMPFSLEPKKPAGNFRAGGYIRRTVGPCRQKMCAQGGEFVHYNRDCRARPSALNKTTEVFQKYAGTFEDQTYRHAKKVRYGEEMMKGEDRREP